MLIIKVAYQISWHNKGKMRINIHVNKRIVKA